VFTTSVYRTSVTLTTLPIAARLVAVVTSASAIMRVVPDISHSTVYLHRLLYLFRSPGCFRCLFCHVGFSLMSRGLRKRRRSPPYRQRISCNVNMIKTVPAGISVGTYRTRGCTRVCWACCMKLNESVSVSKLWDWMAQLRVAISAASLTCNCWDSPDEMAEVSAGVYTAGACPTGQNRVQLDPSVVT
jgi:hypothetical protein